MITIQTDFESGNIGAWQEAGLRRLRFRAPLDGAPLAMWFYFRMEGAGPGPFEFVLDNLLECLEPTHWEDVRPVMRARDSNWQRARDADVYLDLEQGRFIFHFDLPDQPVEIAYSYPYPPAQAEQLLATPQAAAWGRSKLSGTQPRRASDPLPGHALCQSTSAARNSMGA